MTEHTQNILNYHNPRSSSEKIETPIGGWFVAGFVAFFTAFVVAYINADFVLFLLAFAVVFQLIAFVRSAFTNRNILLAILSLALIPVYGALLTIPARGHDRTAHAQVAKARSDLKTLEDAVEQFNVEVGRYPTADEGFDILVDNTSNLDNWKGPYIKHFTDPWGNDYHYQSPGAHNTNYDLSSAGPDVQFGTSDDLINW